MRKRTVALISLMAIAGAVYLNNTSLLSSRPAGKPVILAHRGLAQEYSREGLETSGRLAARCYLAGPITA